MSFPRSFIFCGILCSLSALASPGRTEDITGYLYVSDYGAQALDRFSYTYDTVSNTIFNWQPAGADGSTTDAVFINANIKEGLQGTASDIIVVNSGGDSLSRYTLNGVLIGNIPILNANNTPHTLNSVGNVAITPDGKYMYAPESGAGVIDKIDLATGKIVDQVAFAGAHDILIEPDGSILAAAYTGSDSGSSGIWQFDADLGSKTQIIENGANGLTRPTGMSLSSTGTLYIQANVAPTGNLATGANSIFEYSLNPITGAAAFDSKTSSQSIEFDFGSDLGPDGNLYIAALGGGQTHASFGSPTGYVNGVYEFDTTTDAVTNTLAGYEVGTGTPSDGFESPKYIEFGTNFITAPDAGYIPGVPEPGSLAMLSGFAISSVVIVAKRRRRKLS